MITLETIQSSLFPKLYESFLIDDDPLSGEQDWRNVFDYQWDSEQGQGHCGYALLDKGEVVGMLGTIFSTRYIHDARHNFCNLHTWWVREDHRGRSLSLLKPLLKLDGYTITHFTPCDKVRAVSKRLGFKELDSQLKILLPLGIRSGQRGREERALTYDLDIIDDCLVEPDKKLLEDHRLYGCGHLLVRDGTEYCYLLYTHVKRHRLPYCHIHYISNKEVFTAREQDIRSSLLRRHRAWFIAVDARLMRNAEFRLSFDFWAPAHALYKSADLRPEQIDNLYSDIVFLKLTMLPDISHELAQFVRRSWPLSKR